MKILITIFSLLFAMPAFGADFSDPDAIIYINGKITPDTYTNIEETLTFKNNNKPYVILVINSYGGNVSASIGIANLLVRYSRQHNKKLITYAHGMCYSMCTYIFNFGEERIAESTVVFRYHGASIGDAWSPHGTKLQINKLRDMNINQTFVDQMLNDKTFQKINNQYSSYSIKQLHKAGIVTTIAG